MITKTEVISLITKKLPNSQVFVENLKGNDHLQVTVIATEFNGLSLVKQHQLVYSALKELMQEYQKKCKEKVRKHYKFWQNQMKD